MWRVKPTIAVMLAIPIFLLSWARSIGNPKGSSDQSLLQAGKVYRHGEPPLFKSSSKIRIVNFVVKVKAVDYGKVVVTVWSRVRHHTKLTRLNHLANLSKGFQRECDAPYREELRFLGWAWASSPNRPSSLEAVPPNQTNTSKIKRGISCLSGIVVEGALWDWFHGQEKQTGFSVGASLTKSLERKNECPRLHASYSYVSPKPDAAHGIPYVTASMTRFAAT